MVILLIATAGLAVGALATPVIRKHYHLHRLHDADDRVRLDALNTLAGIAVHDPSVAGPLVDALLAEADRSATPGSQAVIDDIAVWAVQRAGAVHQKVGDSLNAADDEHFLRLAGWLNRTGKWNPADRSMADLLRRERLRLASPQPETRLAALAVLQELGPHAAPLVDELDPQLLSDPDEQVRVEAAATAAICLNPAGAGQMMVRLLDDPSPTVHREAMLNLGLLWSAADLQRLADTNAALAESTDPTVLWLLRQAPGAHQRAARALATTDPATRRMAAWTLGFAADAEHDVCDTLVSLTRDADATVAARAAVALGRRSARLTDVAALIKLTEQPARNTRLAGICALGRCVLEPPAEQTALARLRELLADALRSGDNLVAAAAVEALGLRGDDPYLPVMLDIVDELDDQPMVQYAAALAAAQFDESAGFDALLTLCGSTTDELRSLAAFRISLLPNPPVDRLTKALLTGGDPLRGGAALALALCGLRQLDAGRSLNAWLAERLDPASDLFEPSWWIRADYVCARVLCGDPGARRDLDAYLLNANVSRTALFVTLLHCGETVPLDSLLTPNAAIDAESFLGDARFIDVLVRYVPQAPSFWWQEDREVRRWQTDLLRRWWRVHRFRLTFNPDSRTFRTDRGPS